MGTVLCKASLNKAMMERSLAILILSLGCFLSILPVQGGPTCPVCPVCGDSPAEAEGDAAEDEGDAGGDAAEEEGEKKDDEEGGDGDGEGDKDDGEEGEEEEGADGGEEDAKKEKEGCVVEEKTDYQGNDIKQGPKFFKVVEDQEACAKLAVANKKAKFWTYQPSSKKCWIKTSNS